MDITANVRTKEVLGWQGVHLLHYAMSSCSQKVRILLGEKQIDWVSHPVDLRRNEQRSEWFTGINPAAVVPVLVHDGRVHNESNDILVYLDEQFPSDGGSYLPSGPGEQAQAAALLKLEEGLHHHLRAITFTFVVPGKLMKYEFSTSEVASAVSRFDEVLQQLESRLNESAFLCADRVMLPDIAWFINIHRLVLAGYPLWRVPLVARYYDALMQRPAFRQEALAGALLPGLMGAAHRAINRIRRRTLADRFFPD